MINGLNEMLGDIMGRLKTLIDVDSVIGKPIVSGPATVLPVSKLCFGFVTGGTDKKLSLIHISEPRKLFARHDGAYRRRHNDNAFRIFDCRG